MWEQAQGRVETVKFSKRPCPAVEGPLEMWTPLCQSARGPPGPGAYFHYQGHIPEILWGLGTYYRRIKAPKENTHFEAETWIFSFS